MILELTMEFSGGGVRVVVGKVLDCDILVNEFELHFRTNTLGKGMNSLSSLAMG